MGKLKKRLQQLQSEKSLRQEREYDEQMERLVGLLASRRRAAQLLSVQPKLALLAFANELYGFW